MLDRHSIYLFCQWIEEIASSHGLVSRHRLICDGGELYVTRVEVDRSFSLICHFGISVVGEELDAILIADSISGEQKLANPETHPSIEEWLHELFA